MREQRVVAVSGHINKDLARRVVDSLTRLAGERHQPITLVLNSPGGDWEAAYNIAKAVQMLPVPTEGVVLRQAKSGCFIILQRCTRRAAAPDAVLMFHATTMSDTYPIDRIVRLIGNTYVQELQHLSKRTGQNVRQWRQWAAEERLFTPHEALRLGIIDTIRYQLPFL